jgi:hypothetical protein
VLDDLVRQHLARLGNLWVGEATAHQALDGEDGVVGVGNGLASRDLADEAFVVFRVDGDDRWKEPRAFGARDDDRLPTLHHGHHGVRGAQVNADDLAHLYLP